jgi:tetratricopeptide (TPR) repeat protein
MEITKDFHERVISLNKNAMNFIKGNDFKASLTLLKESLNLLSLAKENEAKFKLLATTQNNLACIYKQRKKAATALKYLKLATENEQKAEIEPVTRAGTFLNICAIFSTMGKHKLALEESQKALNLLKTVEESENFFSTLVIAYHNVAVEYEFLKDFKVSLEFYKLACETAEKQLGTDHPLTVSTTLDYRKAEKAIQEHELMAIVKEIDKQESNLKYFNPKREKNKKLLKLQDKMDVLRNFPYKTLKRPKVLRKRLSDGQVELGGLEEVTDGNILVSLIKANQRTKSVSLTPNINNFTPRNFSPARTKNRVVITAPHHTMRIKSVGLQQLKGKEIFSKTLQVKTKPSSLRSKTLLLLQELESLKVQAKQEKIIISNRETPTQGDDLM